MALKFTTSDNDSNALVLTLAGQLDALSAPEILTTIDTLIEEKHMMIVVDMTEVDLIDSSGVAVLVALYKRSRGIGGKMRVTGAKDQPLAIFKLMNMKKVFQIS